MAFEYRLAAANFNFAVALVAEIEAEMINIPWRLARHLDLANVMRERYPKILRRVSGYNPNELPPENGFSSLKGRILELKGTTFTPRPGRDVGA